MLHHPFVDPIYHHYHPYGPGIVLVPDAVPPVVTTRTGKLPDSMTFELPIFADASVRGAIQEVYDQDMDVICEALAAKIPYHVADKNPRPVKFIIKELKHLFE